MRHDYNLPADWQAKSDKQKSIWYTQNRCLRQAIKQDTVSGRKLKKEYERINRKEKARSETVDLKNYR